MDLKKLGGALLSVLSTGVTLFKLLTGGVKPSVGDLLKFSLPQILQAVDNAVKYQGLTTKEQVDAWLQTADANFGADPGALDLVADMPAEAEEEMTDGLIQFVRAYAYYKAGVPGYWVAGN